MPMPTMPTFTTPPTPPTASDPTNFAARADAFVLWLVTFVAEITAFITAMLDVGAYITRSVSGTSASTVTLANNTDLTFTIQAGLGIVAGYHGLLASTANPTNQARGIVKSYNDSTGATVLTVPSNGVSGAASGVSSWTFGIIPVSGKADAASVRSASNDTDYVTAKSLADSADWAALTDGATINWDTAALGYNTKVTLGGNRTFAAPTNIKPGLAYAIAIKQDATGSRVPAWNSAFDFRNGSAPTLSTGAGKEDFIYFHGNVAGDKLVYTGFGKSA